VAVLTRKLLTLFGHCRHPNWAGAIPAADPIVHIGWNEYFIAIYRRGWESILRFAPQPGH
jgi:hypothetical protein